MGIYQAGLRAVVRRAMEVAEHRIGAAGELGRPLASPVTDAPPVLLVHGYGNDSRSMVALSRSLERDGFRPFSIDLPEFGFGDAVADATKVRERVDEIVAQTGASRIDLVGHSRGGLVSRTAKQLLDDDGRIGRVVTLSSANQGVHLGPFDRIASAVIPEGMHQLRRGAKLIEDLRTTAAGHDLVPVGTIGVDGVLVPASAAQIPGRAFHAVDEGRRIGPFSKLGHWTILRDDVSYETIRGALMLPRG